MYRQVTTNTLGKKPEMHDEAVGHQGRGSGDQAVFGFAWPPITGPEPKSGPCAFSGFSKKVVTE
jgi:hypothetical protein